MFGNFSHEEVAEILKQEQTQKETQLRFELTQENILQRRPTRDEIIQRCE